MFFKQLSTYLKDSKLLFNHQYRFRQKYSTKYAALELTDRIITQLDKEGIPINIYLYLSKDFDTSDHTILIDKLKYYGVHGINLKLFSSYLENRKQYTEIDNIKSNQICHQLQQAYHRVYYCIIMHYYSLYIL